MASDVIYRQRSEMGLLGMNVLMHSHPALKSLLVPSPAPVLTSESKCFLLPAPTLRLGLPHWEFRLCYRRGSLRWPRDVTLPRTPGFQLGCTSPSEKYPSLSPGGVTETGKASMMLQATNSELSQFGHSPSLVKLMKNGSSGLTRASLKGRYVTAL